MTFKILASTVALKKKRRSLLLFALLAPAACMSTVAATTEVYSTIARRLKEQSPVAHTVVVTLANGMANSGYSPNDTAFGAYTFQVFGSRLQPGCADRAIDNGLLDLIEADEK